MGYGSRVWRALQAAGLVLAFGGCGVGSSVGSVGAVLGRDNETRAVFVREAPPGLAAERAGLLPGDEIVMLDGHYVRGLSSRELRALLRGDVGSTVLVTLVRGKEVRRVTLTRSELRGHEETKPREEKIAE
jgi:C-terminal processing protease CtpA/Prc